MMQGTMSLKRYIDVRDISIVCRDKEKIYGESRKIRKDVIK